MESTSRVSLETHQDVRRGQAGGDAGFDGVARALHPRNEIQLQRRGELSVVRAARALERAMDRSFGGDEVGDFTEHDKDFVRLAFGYVFQPFNISGRALLPRSSTISFSVFLSGDGRLAFLRDPNESASTGFPSWATACRIKPLQRRKEPPQGAFGVPRKSLALNAGDRTRV